MKVKLLVIGATLITLFNGGTAIASKEKVSNQKPIVCYHPEAPLSNVSRSMGLKPCSKNGQMLLRRYCDVLASDLFGRGKCPNSKKKTRPIRALEDNK